MAEKSGKYLGGQMEHIQGKDLFYSEHGGGRFPRTLVNVYQTD
jgi:hypothetical protein